MGNTGEATITAPDHETQDNQTSGLAQDEQVGPDLTAATQSQTEETAATGVSGPKPDVSDQGYQELLPRLMNYFHNREELARALGLHRSTVDRWLNGKSRPNNSTVLRMRRIAQERDIQ